MLWAYTLVLRSVVKTKSESSDHSPMRCCYQNPVCQSSNWVSTRHESPQASELWDVGGELSFPFTLCSGFLSVVGEKQKTTPWPKVTGNGRVYFHLQVTISHWGKSGQELEADTMRERCLLAHSGSCSACFLIQLKTSCVGRGAAHSGLCPPASINNQILIAPYRHAHRPIWAVLTVNNN